MGDWSLGERAAGQMGRHPALRTPALIGPRTYSLGTIGDLRSILPNTPFPSGPELPQPFCPATRSVDKLENKGTQEQLRMRRARPHGARPPSP